VIYSLDTNACIALINGTPPAVRDRLSAALTRGATIAIPTIVAFELWYGVAQSRRHELNARRVAAFLDGPVELLPFEEEDARAAGRVRAGLEEHGAPIGAYDVLIAGQAIARGATVVTSNASELARIKGLEWEDWSQVR
jgi:tRNA(fMet)-specific endonuclease VapC